MRSHVLLWFALAVACSRSPQAEAPEQPTVEVPPAPEASSEPDDDGEGEDSELPSSRRDQARRSHDDEEDEGLDHNYEPPSSGHLFPPTSGPTGGPDCEAVADCCHKLMAVMGSATSDPRMCEQLRTAPSALCAQAVAQIGQIATQHGVHCQP